MRILAEIQKLSPNLLSELPLEVATEMNAEDFPCSRVDLRGKNVLVRLEWDRGCFTAYIATVTSSEDWRSFEVFAELIGTNLFVPDFNGQRQDLSVLRQLIEFLKANYPTIEESFSRERIFETKTQLEEIAEQRTRQFFLRSRGEGTNG